MWRFLQNNYSAYGRFLSSLTKRTWGILTKSWIHRSFLFLSSIGLFLGGAYWSSPDPLIAYSPMLYDKEGSLLSVNLNTQEKWRLPVHTETVPQKFIDILISFEDKRFYSHPGVDLLALLRASWQWIKNGQVVSGGSTLTMQTVRLLNPRPRTLINKIIEIYQAIGLEINCSKSEILQLYLSLAPYGGNIEGLRTASWVYFRQNPGTLTPAQMALLVVVPQHPNRFNPFQQQAASRAARDKVLRRLEGRGFLSSVQLEEMLEEPIPKIKHHFPSHAPHVMRVLKQRRPKEYQLQSTLDYRLQRNLEALLLQISKGMELHQTVAGIIVDNKTREIRAYVGSADSFNEEKQGYVDMVRAIRSPGSALKPFIYGLGFEDALIHPAMIMDDVLTDFQGYNPTNFRDIFHGDVTVREALQQSLNIPVIHLLDRLGPGRFVDWLANAGIPLYFPRDNQSIGLPVALGGVGIRFQDLVGLYVALARGGFYQKPDFEKLRSVPVQLLQAKSCHQVTDILEGAPLPKGFADWISTGKPAIAFKTGTSYGGRDAICVGYSPEYTVGIWVGRADGTACPNQVGRETAAPIVLQIFQSLLPASSSFSYSSEKVFIPISASHFKKGHSDQELVGMRIQYPKPDSIHLLKRRHDGSIRPISVSIKGGHPPFTCWMNGQSVELPITSSEVQGNKSRWMPPGIGFHTLTIVDRDGKKSSVTVQFVED